MSVEETNGTSGDSSLTVVTLFVIVVFGIVGFCTIIPYIYSIDETVTGYVEDVQYFTPERLASQDTIIVFENGNTIIFQGKVEIPLRQNVTIHYKQFGNTKRFQKIVVN